MLNVEKTLRKIIRSTSLVPKQIDLSRVEKNNLSQKMDSICSIPGMCKKVGKILYGISQYAKGTTITTIPKQNKKTEQVKCNLPTSFPYPFIDEEEEEKDKKSAGIETGIGLDWEKAAEQKQNKPCRKLNGLEGKRMHLPNQLKQKKRVKPTAVRIRR